MSADDTAAPAKPPATIIATADQGESGNRPNTSLIARSSV
jgi:hypothetical protein